MNDDPVRTNETGLPMRKTMICVCGLLLGAAGILSGGESYSELMDRAEKLTGKRYDPASRAYKIKAAELDEILDSKAGREEKIRRLKEFIRELENSGENRVPEEKKPAESRPRKPDPLHSLKTAAEQGDADAQYRLGIIYREGKEVRRSLRLALAYFRRAAAKGHRPARFMLALADMNGKGVIPDEKKAFAKFRELYDGGFDAAGIPLGVLYYEGRGTEKNYAAAAECLRRGLKAKNGMTPEISPETILGRMYYTGGFGLKPDFSEAFKYLKPAGRNPENQYLLGCLCRDGKGTPRDPAAAAAYFRQAAEQGHLRGEKEFGKLCHYGLGVKKDDLLAVRYLSPAAERNDPEAALLLAEIHADEKSPAGDVKNALKYFRIAARSGNPAALYRCGEMILNGKGTEKDAAAALEYLKAAAKGNHAEAAFLCGKIEQAGKCPGQCIGYYRQAADLGHPEGLRIFAGMALGGQYMKADPVLGIRYLKRLAGQGDLAACEQLGELYETGIGPVRADQKEAVFHYTAAAEKGSVKAQLRLGQLYYALGDREKAMKYAAMAAERKNPEGVLLLNKLQHPAGKKQDSSADSDRYLRELADSGNREAMKQLGRQLYSRGRLAEAEKYLKTFENENDAEILFMLGTVAGERSDGQEDRVRAFQLMRRAAESGHVKALIGLGRMYHRGEGVRQDFRQALLCYRGAAEKKDPEGMFLTGCMFYNGEGVSPDYMEAYRWFRQAAEMGNVLAMQYLSIMFKEGIGVPKNNLEAVKWRRKASGGK